VHVLHRTGDLARATPNAEKRRPTTQRTIRSNNDKNKQTNNGTVWKQQRRAEAPRTRTARNNHTAVPQGAALRLAALRRRNPTWNMIERATSAGMMLARISECKSQSIFSITM
jgi:hypothetical protein